MQWKLTWKEKKIVDRLPALTHKGAALLSLMVSQERWRQCADRVKLSRRGGYCGEDALLFLILFLSQGTRNRVQFRLRHAASRKEGSFAGVFVWSRARRPAVCSLRRRRSMAHATNFFQCPLTSMQRSWMTA